MATPQPGWYDDPTAPGRLRWWDGERWTEQTRVPPPVGIPDPSRTEPRQDVPPPPPGRSGEPSPGSFDRFSTGGPSGSGTGGATDPDFGTKASVPPWQGSTPPGPAQQASNRRRQVVAGTVAVGIAGIGAALAFAVAGDGNVFELEVGQCFDDDPTTSGEDVYQIDEVPIVECDEPHDNEVYAVYDVGFEAFPGTSSLQDHALQECAGHFVEQVGFPVELTDLDLSALWPTRESWDAGDREVVCFLYDFDLAPLSGTRIGLADRPTVFSLDVGDCFDAPDLTSTPVTGAEVRDCSQPHFGEVYAVLDAGPGPWPGRGPLLDESDLDCLDRFEPYVGEPWEASVLYYGVLPPSQDSWEAGDRDVLCFLYDLSGDIVGPAPDWAAANSLEGVGQDYDVTHLVLGDCFDDDFEGGTFPEVPCDDPHDNEVFHVFELPDGPYPGEDEVFGLVFDECDPAYLNWVGGDRPDLEWFSFHPSAQNWADGDRRVVCSLYDADFDELEQSQRRAV